MAKITLQKGSVSEGPEKVGLEGTEKTILLECEEISSTIHVLMTLHLTLQYVPQGTAGSSTP